MTSFEEHLQWPAIQKIQSTLKKAGFQSYIAGGAVRDLFLGRMPNDLDIATDAKPEQVDELFEKTVMVGKEFGVSRVIIDGQDIEVATFRKDGPYADGRKPESIEFSNIVEDSKRRDFTINAMFYDTDKKEIIDHVGGQNDLMKKLIKAVGEPDKRFDEDKLRILRALRFHSQLGFAIEQKTAEAIKKYSLMMHQVSMERVRDEWIKLLNGEYAVRAITRTYDLNLWSPLFDAWKFQSDEYQKHFSLSNNDSETQWIIWFLIHCQESKEKLAETGLHWKLPKALLQKMIYCFQSLPQLRNIQNVEPVDLAIFLGKPNGRLAVEIYQRLHQGRIKEQFFEKLKAAESFFEGGELPQLLVSGDDLIQYGLAPGPKIAQELKRLHRIQLLEKISNKEELLTK